MYTEAKDTEGDEMDKVQKHNLKLKRSYNLFLLLPFLVLGVMMWSSGSADKELQTQQSTYCEMVEIYNISDGANGWPDYEGTYDEACK
jgi:uncharacterized membrane protein